MDFIKGENFHESSIALNAYYIILTPANAVIVFNNYTAALQYGGVFQSRVSCAGIQRLQGHMVCCSWNNTTLSTRKVPSLRGQSGQVLANVEQYT